jgi:hypothetical protein
LRPGLSQDLLSHLYNQGVEATLELARCRTAEMEERLRQIGAKGQAWMGVAQVKHGTRPSSTDTNRAGAWS